MSNENNKPSKYYNFGVGWAYEDTETLSFLVDWSKNKKANKEIGYKMYLVPVDATGNPSGEGVEVTRFRVKKVEKKEGPGADKIPDFKAYAWE